MLKPKPTIFAILLYLAFGFTGFGQTPSDALMMSKRVFCVAGVYSNDTWNQYWEGSFLRKNENVGTLTRQTFSPMFAYGFTDRLTVIATLPYVSTEASGGQMVGASGFQDISVFAKYQFIKYDGAKSNFNVFLTAGFGTPSTNYLSDYMPFSLGLGAQEISGRAIVHYEWNEKLYSRGSFAYLHRTTTEAERDYYYANGSHYSTTMDIPSATNAEFALGCWFFNHGLQLETSLISQTSLSGDDIRTHNSGQPTNKMNLTLLNGRFRYFLLNKRNFSILGGYSSTINGRNVGKSNVISAGITYQFGL